MYQAYYKKQRRKSMIIIIFLITFAVVSTYLIYEKFSTSRNTDYEAGEMEVVFHEKRGNEVSLTKFTPVTDAVGLTSPSYTFTVKNNTSESVKYKVKLVLDKDKMKSDGCSEKQIPNELLKLSFRKDHQAPKAYILSEFTDSVIYTDTLEAGKSEDYSIRLWAIDSNFLVDKTSHYHALIEVEEEE